MADGVCGGGTQAAIELYQHGVVGHDDPVGIVRPDGSTLKALRAGMPPGLLAEKLQGIMVHAAAATVGHFFEAILLAMQTASIDTPLRQAHFLAQIAHESGELRYTEELASGAQYEGRKDLGNTKPGDGPRFKGRGLIQLTGRRNYAAYGASIGKDLTEGDAMRLVATDAGLAVGVATWFWTTHRLNALADADDVVTITKRINGGTNGLDDRKEKLERAKFFLTSPHADAGESALIHAMEAVAAMEADR